jgi:outer membrane receptor protein involved in Fe transport
MVDARALGFRDVVDAGGNVVYPAEAFLYGGRSFLVLPPELAAYEDKQGNPEAQLGVLAEYELRDGRGFTLSGNYFSSVYSGRLRLVELPSAYVFNFGVFWELENWQFKYDVLNVFDERYFRARTGDTLGDVLVSAMPGRRWQLTLRARF